MTKKLFTFVLFVASASCTAYAQRPKESLSHLQSQHRAILRKWLAERPWLRPATEDDCTDEGNLASMRRALGKNVHPYYSVGDFNGDGRRDFAVLLVVKGKAEAALAVFNAPFRKAAPTYFERGFEKLGNMYIAYNYTAKNRLYLGVFESDYYCMTLIPKGGKYTYEDCER